MTDFVIVIATAAGLATPVAPGPATSAPAGPTAATSSIPLNAPIVGFRTYQDAAPCGQAAALVAPPTRASFACR